MIVSIILAFDADEPLRALLLFVFAAIVVVGTLFALRARPARVVRLVETTMGTSGQLAVRLSVLLIVALAVLASEFGLDVVILGAFRRGNRRRHRHPGDGGAGVPGKPRPRSASAS